MFLTGQPVVLPKLIQNSTLPPYEGIKNMNRQVFASKWIFCHCFFLNIVKTLSQLPPDSLDGTTRIAPAMASVIVVTMKEFTLLCMLQVYCQ